MWKHVQKLSWNIIMINIIMVAGAMARSTLNNNNSNINSSVMYNNPKKIILGVEKGKNHFCWFTSLYDFW